MAPIVNVELSLDSFWNKISHRSITTVKCESGDIFAEFASFLLDREWISMGMEWFRKKNFWKRVWEMRTLPMPSLSSAMSWFNFTKKKNESRFWKTKFLSPEIMMYKFGFYHLLVTWRIDGLSMWQWCHLEKWWSFLMTYHLLVASIDVTSISKKY